MKNKLTLTRYDVADYFRRRLPAWLSACCLVSGRADGMCVVSTTIGGRDFCAVLTFGIPCDDDLVAFAGRIAAHVRDN